MLVILDVPSIADGSVKPVVAAEVPITEAGDAHEMLDYAQTVGKVLLNVCDA